MTCFSTVLSICSSALRAVRCMSAASAPTAVLNTVRIACNHSYFDTFKFDCLQPD